MKEPILDADYTTIRPGRGGRVEETRKRRRQFWAATIQGLALAAGLMTITAGVTAMLMQVLG